MATAAMRTCRTILCAQKPFDAASQVAPCSTMRRSATSASRPGRPSPPLPSRGRGVRAHRLRACRRSRAAGRAWLVCDFGASARPQYLSSGARRAIATTRSLSAFRASGDRSVPETVACRRPTSARSASPAIPRARPSRARHCAPRPTGWRFREPRIDRVRARLERGRISEWSRSAGEAVMGPM